MDERKPMRELTRIRQERGLTQQGLADASGVNKATINQIEGGRRSPNVETLEKLADALGVELADLFPKAQAPLPLEELAASAQPRGRFAAKGHLTVSRTWEDIEASLSLDQILEIAKGMVDGRFSVREDQARSAQELLQELEKAGRTTE
jgi:transcriptional regulator with XRE-family HTH domain